VVNDSTEFRSHFANANATLGDKHSNAAFGSSIFVRSKCKKTDNNASQAHDCLNHSNACTGARSLINPEPLTVAAPDDTTTAQDAPLVATPVDPILSQQS
jgi:hypothetical protein